MIDRLNLKNKVALITGGAGFLAKYHMEALLEKEAKVILIDKNLKKLKSLKRNPNLIFYKCDITNLNSIKKINNKIIKTHKKIDILINNAANDFKVSKKITRKRSTKIDLSSWQSDIDVNLTGSLYCTVIFSESMLKRKKGVILNISSDLSLISPDQRLYNHLGLIKPVSYSVTKHGLVGMTKYFSTLWANSGIRVNSLSPGAIKHEQDSIFVRKIKKLIPMNRMGDAEEIKGVLQFLCSDASSYMTGQNIIIDGGRSIW